MHNIAFLNPALLPALLAALLPILLHLLTRRKMKNVEISSVVFLQQLQKRKMRRVKVRQWLLLVLRTLIILFVVLIFCQPVVRSSFPFIAGGTSTSAVILLDNSYSMGFETPRGRLFDLSKQRALEVISFLNPGDEVSLIPFADSPSASRQLRIKDRDSAVSPLRDLVLDVKLSNRATDVGVALKQAADVLRNSSNANKEIYLLTDLEENGWRSLPEEKVSAELKGIPIYLVPAEADQGENVVVEQVVVPRQILSAQSAIKLEVHVTNNRKSDVRGLVLSLYLDNVRLAQTTLDMEAGQTERAVFEVASERTGELSGYVEIEPDRLAVDNRRYFTVRIPSRIKVLLIGEREADAYFVGRALNPSGSEEALVQTVSTGREELSLQQIEDSAVIVMANVRRLNQWQVEKLLARVKQGTGLLICLGPEADREFYNQQLLPRLFQAQLGELMGIAGENSSFYSFGKMDFSHPILKGLLPQDRLDSPQLYAFYQTAASPKAEPIIWYNEGSTALCESGLGRGRIVLFTSAVSLDWTDLPLKGIFAPLFHRIVQYLASVLPEEAQQVGEPIERTWGQLEGPVECQNPTGERLSLSPVPGAGGVRWQLDSAETPGVWKLFSQGIEVERIAVNVNSRESSPEKIAEEQIRPLLGDIPFKIVPEGKDLKKEVEQARYGRELWRTCLILALILMAAEMAVAFTSAADRGKQQKKGGEIV